jgi:hypothetical protein
MGRPKLEPGRAKESTFSVRLTAEAREQIEAATVAAGYRSASKWARSVLLDAAARSRSTP